MFGIPTWLFLVVLAGVAWWRWRPSLAILWIVVALIAVFGPGVVDAGSAVAKQGLVGVKDTASTAWQQAGRVIHG